MKRILFAAGFCCALSITVAQNVVQAEYFLDTDRGFGNNSLVDLTPAADGTFQVAVNFTNASPGYHKLYFRTKSSDGAWSQTSRRNIELVATAGRQITGGEYFFDIDPGLATGNIVTVSPQDSAVFQNFTALAAALSPGYHKLYIRMKDSQGKWSQTARRNFEVLQPMVDAVSRAEYFFNTDPGAGNANQAIFDTAMINGTFSFTIPLANIPTGADTLYLRVRDSANSNWSLTAWQADSLVTSVRSGLWSDINTWSNRKIPVSSTVVILHHSVIVDINAFCRSLTPYRNDVNVTVNQGIILSITGH